MPRCGPGLSPGVERTARAAPGSGCRACGRRGEVRFHRLPGQEDLRRRSPGSSSPEAASRAIRSSVGLSSSGARRTATRASSLSHSPLPLLRAEALGRSRSPPPAPHAPRACASGGRRTCPGRATSAQARTAPGYARAPRARAQARPQRPRGRRRAASTRPRQRAETARLHGDPRARSALLEARRASVSPPLRGRRRRPRASIASPSTRQIAGSRKPTRSSSASAAERSRSAASWLAGGKLGEAEAAARG